MVNDPDAASLHVSNAYEGVGMTPEIETSDNAFKITVKL
jgi:hypothetical protein